MKFKDDDREPKEPPASVRQVLEYLKARRPLEQALEERQKAEEAKAQKLKAEQEDARRTYSREYRARVRKEERLQKLLAEVEEKKKQEVVEEEKKKSEYLSPEDKDARRRERVRQYNHKRYWALKEKRREEFKAQIAENKKRMAEDSSYVPKPIRNPDSLGITDKEWYQIWKETHPENEKHWRNRSKIYP